jgi:hypothetical protein
MLSLQLQSPLISSCYPQGFRDHVKTSLLPENSPTTLPLLKITLSRTKTHPLQMFRHRSPPSHLPTNFPPLNLILASLSQENGPPPLPLQSKGHHASQSSLQSNPGHHLSLLPLRPMWKAYLTTCRGFTAIPRRCKCHHRDQAYADHIRVESGKPYFPIYLPFTNSYHRTTLSQRFTSFSAAFVSLTLPSHMQSFTTLVSQMCTSDTTPIFMVIGLGLMSIIPSSFQTSRTLSCSSRPPQLTATSTLNNPCSNSWLVSMSCQPHWPTMMSTPFVSLSCNAPSVQIHMTSTTFSTIWLVFLTCNCHCNNPRRRLTMAMWMIKTTRSHRGSRESNVLNHYLSIPLPAVQNLLPL